MRTPNQTLVLENCTIQLYDETGYESDSSDYLHVYEKIYISGNHRQTTSSVGIELIVDDLVIASCLINSEGGATAITENTILISYNSLVICCSNTVFKLSLPSLSLEWKTVADAFTCFGIYYLEEDYLVHGELELSRLDKTGKILWQNGGRDIWTTLEGKYNIEICDNYILAVDWTYTAYKFSFDGRVLEEYQVSQKNQFGNTPERKKKWWKW
ncbi:hypothetical protein [Pedobacter soli]|uniref:Uncharacterized protein n=1 Tax=Pedobacter soli TaxID=390242 RepID=A0A1G6Q574_9SPHI|nr:hypothetical protein [Pedobacter soli]SDC86765.1 hypothetical protein SAMN04488024_103229 [Pedobacter soli]